MNDFTITMSKQHRLYCVLILIKMDKEESKKYIDTFY